jgi:hypothetical protein
MQEKYMPGAEDTALVLDPAIIRDQQQMRNRHKHKIKAKFDIN